MIRLLPFLFSALLLFAARCESATVQADTVLASDTHWYGEVTVRGVVVVARAATLTIEPGTTVRFEKVDRNGDGIGDSELRVLGGINAIGMPDRMIRFMSAEASSSPGDWSYVMIFTSPQNNVIRYCEFSGAFTGLQAHFSTAAVSCCIFHGNNEGMRFGRARLVIENSEFHHNDIGIRFTRMEGPVIISRNNITQNRIGMFLAPSGQNIADFFEPERSGRPWNTGKLSISGNNIHDNLWYNLNLGERQSWDLDVSGNWWGSGGSMEMGIKIFDRNRDISLGSALYRPFLERPAANAGVRYGSIKKTGVADSTRNEVQPHENP
ncbi:MAG: right-handed parallel beta-helix repeat-containing protein [Nitrospirae bacterium]|nr:right-handed parallel beta-helix repeat-containing protein [Nitrospirota bacterium]